MCLEITTHPQDKLVALDSMVSLTCSSSVSSDVTFSWTHDGRNVTVQSASTGDTSILAINKVKRKRDSGSYVCTVMSGSLSVTSNTATLKVYGMLQFTFLNVLKYCEHWQVLQRSQITQQGVMYQWEEASPSCVELVV